MISELITLISYHYIVNLKKDRGGNIMAYATLAGGCFWCMVKPLHLTQVLKMSYQVIVAEI